MKSLSTPHTWAKRCLALGLWMAALSSLAQPYPNKTVRLLVPFPAGGATDIFARALSQKLPEKLGAAVFGDHTKLRALERILHPLVAEAQSEFLGAHRLKPAIVLDVPLLFEKGGWRRCHMTVVVSAPYRVQRARVLARPGMTPQKFAGILKGQMPDREKRALADVVIETGRGRRETWLEVKQLIDGL